MRRSILISLISVTIFMFAFFVNADAPEWSIDKDHTGIYFSVKHIYSVVNGYFDDYDGTIVFDPDNLDQSRCEFTVKVKSIDTNNSKRDNHLLSKDFFDAGEYPIFTFKSTSIKHTGENQYSVEGNMVVKDVTKSITVPFKYFGSKPNPLNPKQLVAGFEAQMTIDRLEYNVGGGKFYEMGVVGREVNIVISMEAIRDI